MTEIDNGTGYVGQRSFKAYQDEWHLISRLVEDELTHLKRLAGTSASTLWAKRIRKLEEIHSALALKEEQ